MPAEFIGHLSHALRRLTGTRCPPSLGRNMKPPGSAKHFILAFLLALVGYCIFYQAIEHRRTRKGPWQVTFTRDAAGAPAIVIDQPRLAITNVQISFPGETLPLTNRTGALVSTTRCRTCQHQSPVTHRQPALRPATVGALRGSLRQMRLHGYHLPAGNGLWSSRSVTRFELLPRVLVIDRQEHSWQLGAALRLHPAPKEPVGARPKADSRADGAVEAPLRLRRRPGP